MRSKFAGEFRKKESKSFESGVVVIVESRNRWGFYIAIQVTGSSSDQNFLTIPAGNNGYQWSRFSNWVESRVLRHGSQVSRIVSPVGKFVGKMHQGSLGYSSETRRQRTFADVVCFGSREQRPMDRYTALEHLIISLKEKVDILTARVQRLHTSQPEKFVVSPPIVQDFWGDNENLIILDNLREDKENSGSVFSSSIPDEDQDSSEIVEGSKMAATVTSGWGSGTSEVEAGFHGKDEDCFIQNLTFEPQLSLSPFAFPSGTFKAQPESCEEEENSKFENVKVSSGIEVHHNDFSNLENTELTLGFESQVPRGVEEQSNSNLEESELMELSIPFDQAVGLEESETVASPMKEDDMLQLSDSNTVACNEVSSAEEALSVSKEESTGSQFQNSKPCINGKVGSHKEDDSGVDHYHVRDHYVDTSWGSDKVFDVGPVKTFNIKVMLKEVELTMDFDNLPHGEGRTILIEGEYFDGATIFESLKPPERARVSKIAFKLWRRNVGRPLLKKLRHYGVNVSLDLYDKAPT